MPDREIHIFSTDRNRLRGSVFNQNLRKGILWENTSKTHKNMYSKRRKCPLQENWKTHEKVEYPRMDSSAPAP